MKNRNFHFIAVYLLSILITTLITACTLLPRQAGTGWGVGAFDSNGERIYFTASSESDTDINYSGGPSSSMMMGGGELTCASCHAPDGRGGLHTMMGMQVMDAPDIRWETLVGELEGEHGNEEEGIGNDDYDLDTFRLAVEEGKHPDGDPLSTDMPRWDMTDEDLFDLAEFLMTLQ